MLGSKARIVLGMVRALSFGCNKITYSASI